MQIQAHNVRVATVWGSAGRSYDKVSECIADSIEHMLNRIDVKPGERVLDLATGTGWTARRLAQKGAHVTTILRMPSGKAAWDIFVDGYGPTKAVYQSTDRKDELKRDFIAFHDAYRTEMGIAMPRDYLVIIGTRR